MSPADCFLEKRWKLHTAEADAKGLWQYQLYIYIYKVGFFLLLFCFGLANSAINDSFAKTDWLNVNAFSYLK